MFQECKPRRLAARLDSRRHSMPPGLLLPVLMCTLDAIKCYYLGRALGERLGAAQTKLLYDWLMRYALAFMSGLGVCGGLATFD